MPASTRPFRLAPWLSSAMAAACLCLAAHPAQAQTNVPLDGFESYTAGALSGQGGWSVLNFGGTDQVAVSTDAAYEGSRSAYIYDGDNASRPKAVLDLATTTSAGTIRFAVMEAAGTTARDLWRFDALRTGSNITNFSVFLVNSTTLAFANGTTTLATVDPTTTSYNPSAWNTFEIIFDDGAKTASVFLNGGDTPIFNVSSAATTFQAGRLGLSVGSTAAVGQGVYFDCYPFPNWETTSRLRYAPPTLVAPSHYTMATSYQKLILADGEDAIIQVPAVKRTNTFEVQGGRNVQIIGGDQGAHTFACRQQSGSVFLEGVKFNFADSLTPMNGCLVDVDRHYQKDVIDVNGIDTSGDTAPNIFIQNCSILGVHGTNQGDAAGVPISTMSFSASTATYTITTAAPHGMTGTPNFVCGATSLAPFNDTYTVVSVTSNTVTAKRVTKWPVTGTVHDGDQATGGYLWPSTGGKLHADAYQCQTGGLEGTLYFYKDTIDSSYQGFIGGHTLDNDQALGLVMCRVNMRVNNIWPQDQNSKLLYMGDTDQSAGSTPGTNARLASFPVDLDRVYIRPRAIASLLSVLNPGGGTQTRFGVDISASSLDGGQTASWVAAADIGGKVTRSADGFSGETGFTGKDYADLTAAHPPGVSYVSPGYSPDQIVPVSAGGAITWTPAGGTVSVSATAGSGTIITPLDVVNPGQGHVLTFSLSANVGGFFAISGRSLTRSGTGTLTAGTTYPVTVRATDEVGNKIDQVIQIQAH